ncbi:MAG: 4-hydroxythreonine-4-phosphate dehydrogenase PdxA [Longimicrobiales bacterium]
MVRLAVTLGDPRGIGPEVVSGATRALVRDDVELVLVGPTGTVADSVGEAERVELGRWTGAGDGPTAGRLAGEAIRHAAGLALRGEVDGIVTAPIDKRALRAGGFAYPGHTEMLAALCDVCPVGMLMCAERTGAGGTLRVLLATTHIALSDVPRALSADLLVDQTSLLHDALRDEWGLERPRLALCAVNPHASDDGLFGDEEARLLRPALVRLGEAGIAAAGPIPADTVFVRALRGEFDAVVAPYHDVGMAAFKTAAFGHGVNVTLGLPFVRTSPDHGTALDIAGRGVADVSSMMEAIALAVRLVHARRPVEANRS